MRGLDVIGASSTTHGWWQTGVIVAAIFAATVAEIAYLRGRR